MDKLTRATAARHFQGGLVKQSGLDPVEMIEEICRFDGIHAHFSATVRNIREERGMTLHAFGAALGLSHSHIWHIEHGSRRMSLSSLRRLKGFLLEK